nr:hypothetical protein [Terriglobales bacterium]
LVSWVALVSVQRALAYKDFSMPAAKDAKTYSAHDGHPTEQVTVGAEPYETSQESAVFSLHLLEQGFLPVFVVVTNDGDQPVALAAMKAQLITAKRSKIPPASADDINRRLAHPSASASRTSPLPFPKKAKGGLSGKQIQEIQNAQFAAKAVEPHATQAGFLFFDISGIDNPLPGSNLYLTGLQDAKGNDLMFFEISLRPTHSIPAP